MIISGVMTSCIFMIILRDLDKHNFFIYLFLTRQSDRQTDGHMTLVELVENLTKHKTIHPP